MVSSITAITTGVPRKPMARMVAISRARPATAAYMVFNAPNTAPMAMMVPMTVPRILISLASPADCLL